MQRNSPGAARGGGPVVLRPVMLQIIDDVKAELNELSVLFIVATTGSYATVILCD